MADEPVIMVLEDNPITQETLKRELTSMGFSLLPATAADMAWDLLNHGSRPDVLILDFQLPGEDGPSFFRRLQMDKQLRSIPVVPFTVLRERADPASHSKINDFVAARSIRNSRIQMIVSKNGREDVVQIPPGLFIALGAALTAAGKSHPAAFRVALRKALLQLADPNPSEDEFV